ncbi:MAG TPA: hypothetical protein VGG72_05260 [Bryobacteraceae bacterium]|jgi:hypothetical protein
MLRRLILLVLSASAAVAQPQSKLFEQVGPILDGLSQITGWKVERKVPAEILRQSDFKRQMQEHMKDDSPKEVRAEELTLKMFGLVPPDFKLVDETVDLLSEQAAAFYDYNKKRLFILDSTKDDEEAHLALVHELAHALADQHHNLGKYMREGSPDDDASTARQAVMEGQATWLSWAYLFWSRNGKGEIPENRLDELANSAGADGPVYSSAPLYIRESLVFPYNRGIVFQDAVFRKLGRAAFDEVFDHPPVSTQQILHPDDYFAKLKPDMTDAPNLDGALGKPAAHQFRTLAEGTLGEFDVSALLRQYTEERAGAAEATHFRGGAYRLYENKRDKHPVLTFVVDWDSPEAAETFLALYRQVLKAKWKRMAVTGQSATEVSGTGDDGKFQVRRMGNAVQSLEGLP